MVGYKIKGEDAIDGTESQLSSNDIRERVAYLESERDDLVETYNEAFEAAKLILKRPSSGASVKAAKGALKDWEADHGAELVELSAVENSIGRHATLIAEDSFEDYARDYFESMGDDKAQGWPYNCIDWEKAAHELSHDFSCIDIFGHSFYYND